MPVFENFKIAMAKSNFADAAGYLFDLLVDSSVADQDRQGVVTYILLLKIDDGKSIFNAKKLMWLNNTLLEQLVKDSRWSDITLLIPAFSSVISPDVGKMLLNAAAKHLYFLKSISPVDELAVQLQQKVCDKLLCVVETASVNSSMSRQTSGLHSLHYFAAAGELELFLRSGADAFLRGSGGTLYSDSPFEMAVRHRRWEVVLYILKFTQAVNVAESVPSSQLPTYARILREAVKLSPSERDMADRLSVCHTLMDAIGDQFQKVMNPDIQKDIMRHLVMNGEVDLVRKIIGYGVRFCIDADSMRILMRDMFIAINNKLPLSDKLKKIAELIFEEILSHHAEVAIGNYVDKLQNENDLRNAVFEELSDKFGEFDEEWPLTQNIYGAISRAVEKSKTPVRTDAQKMEQSVSTLVVAEPQRQQPAASALVSFPALFALEPKESQVLTKVAEDVEVQKACNDRVRPLQERAGTNASCGTANDVGGLKVPNYPLQAAGSNEAVTVERRCAMLN